MSKDTEKTIVIFRKFLDGEVIALFPCLPGTNNPGGKGHNAYRCQVYETEHPDGTLCKPCPECGYEYGSAWLFEPLPADVVEFITALPHSDAHPWGQR